MNDAESAQVRIDPRGSARRSPTAGNCGQGSKWLHPTTRRRIYERDGWKCVWCHVEVERPTLPEDGILVRGGIIHQASIDHVVPRSRGGSNRPSNLITCCARCNAKRGERSVPTFAEALVWPVWGVLGAKVAEEVARIERRVRAAQRRKLPRIENA